MGRTANHKNQSLLGLDDVGDAQHLKVQIGGLAERFVVPPFSIFDAQTDVWRKRKNAWLLRGMREEMGRKDDLLLQQFKPGKYKKSLVNLDTTSYFDPVLCEVCFHNFCPPGGTIIDPFAGGVVRGGVASHMGFRYIGIDLRQEQVDANREALAKMMEARRADEPESVFAVPPIWHVGDSRNIDQLIEGVKADMVFTCPPYYDLEKYSQDPLDLSNMSYEEFQLIYGEILIKAASLCKDTAEFFVVIGNIRDKAGFYRLLTMDTVAPLESIGWGLYNEVIFKTPLASLTLRAGKMFDAKKKLGRCHQFVLHFRKRDVGK